MGEVSESLHVEQAHVSAQTLRDTSAGTCRSGHGTVCGVGVVLGNAPLGSGESGAMD